MASLPLFDSNFNGFDVAMINSIAGECFCVLLINEFAIRGASHTAEG